MSTERIPFTPQVRPLRPEHLDRVMDIERAAYPYPWTRTIFEDCLRVGYDCNGLFLGSSLGGYTVQTHAADECHLLNLCIEPALQGQGYGRLMLHQAIRLARLKGCLSMFLEVRPSNTAGVALYRGNGFGVVGTRRDYYRADEGREDAIVMRLELNGPSRGAVPLRGVPGPGESDPF